MIQSEEVTWVMSRETRLKWGLADQPGKWPIATDLTFSHILYYDIQARGCVERLVAVECEPQRLVAVVLSICKRARRSKKSPRGSRWRCE